MPHVLASTRLESVRPQKPSERITEGLIVVDDGDDASLHAGPVVQTLVRHYALHALTIAALTGRG